ncbi:hypothetical protein PVAP13_9KG281352 [Panicum virgatum]|uniref:Uncharacterized protein n=1 Tax=Panicum virgatum TaxID=38727 RepID=A0A8T0NLA6_PANVG|nr:hypothetical protein PVAP13_9KG281352 [Panicum virgatum]
MASPSPPADRAALLKAFDESRTGVRGLVESGVSSVPAIFLHPDPYAFVPLAPTGVCIPIVDLSLQWPPPPWRRPPATGASSTSSATTTSTKLSSPPTTRRARSPPYAPSTSSPAPSARSTTPAPRWTAACPTPPTWTCSAPCRRAGATPWRSRTPTRHASRPPAAPSSSSGTRRPPPWGAPCWASSPGASASAGTPRWRRPPASRAR